MGYRYLDDFRRGISVFAIFSYGIAVLGTPQCPPLYNMYQNKTNLCLINIWRFILLFLELIFGGG